MQVDYPHRCQLARTIENCDNVMNFFNFFEIFYCMMGIDSYFKEIIMMFGIIIIMIQLGFALAYLSDE